MPAPDRYAAGGAEGEGPEEIVPDKEREYRHVLVQRRRALGLPFIYPKPTGVVELLEARGFRADQPNIKFQGNIHFEEYW